MNGIGCIGCIGCIAPSTRHTVANVLMWLLSMFNNKSYTINIRACWQLLLCIPTLLALTCLYSIPLCYSAPAAPAHSLAKTPSPLGLRVTQLPGIVDAKIKNPNLLVELKYASNDNFMKRNLYGTLTQCFLQYDAAVMLAVAEEKLQSIDNNLRLLAYDCARPVSIQKEMWEVVKGTPSQSYVANPNSQTGSIHNYGCAIDLTIATIDDKGNHHALNMGTNYDYFGKLAQPRHEFSFFKSGKISSHAWQNRLLLRQVMLHAGFLPIANEWWHFNCASPKETRKRYQQVP